jgi:predicted ABC-class ATPase
MKFKKKKKPSAGKPTIIEEMERQKEMRKRHNIIMKGVKARAKKRRLNAPLTTIEKILGHRLVKKT